MTKPRANGILMKRLSNQDAIGDCALVHVLTTYNLATYNLQLGISIVECILLRITVSVGDEPILSRSYVRVVISVTTQAYSIGLRNNGRFAMTHHVLRALFAITHYIYVHGHVRLNFGHAITQWNLWPRCAGIAARLNCQSKWFPFRVDWRLLYGLFLFTYLSYK